jgi:hypothetical protein
MFIYLSLLGLHFDSGYPRVGKPQGDAGLEAVLTR